ncbi:hypothetical protein CONPUDRAFT_59017, partial [Coniophora puteana RWD-64-598 SS2]
KLAVRLRKFGALPQDSPWKHDKFLQVLRYQLMSDDEDGWDAEKGKKTNHFVSRAPVYRSKLLNDFLAAVDTIPDPNGKPSYVLRVRGEPKEQEVPVITDISSRTRRWMVDMEWLSQPENKKWDVESRITGNGKVWGDDDDPEELRDKKRKVKAEKKDGREKKRARAGALDVKGKKARVGTKKKDAPKVGTSKSAAAIDVASSDED